MSNTPARRGGPFIDLGQRLIENGYQVVPLPSGSKGPRVPDWRNLNLTCTTFPEFAHQHQEDGIGIVSAKTPAIDIDSTYEPITKAMITWCHDNIGDAPVRVGMAPKALLVYSTSKPFPKVASAWWLAANGSRHRLEVLGDGQQFVAWHIHPDTRKPYVWTSEETPLTLATLDLEEMTHAHALSAAREFDRLCAEHGFTKISESKEATAAVSEDDVWTVEAPPAESEAEVARVRAALFGRADDDKPYVDPDGSRDDYLAVLAALKWTGWLCAREIALEWASASDDKFDAHDFKRDWDSLRQSKGGRTITLATIYGKAKSAGWDASRAPTEEQKTDLFMDLMYRIADLKPGDRTERNVLVAELAHAKLDPLDVAELAKALAKVAKASIKDIRSAMAAARAVETDERTHSYYANLMLQAIEDRTGQPAVGCEGKLWTYDENEGIWVGKEPSDFAVDVARGYDGQENCYRRNDYVSIANHIFSVASIGKEHFFSEAPAGMACDGRFYAINERDVTREALGPQHRQRTLNNVVPRVMPTPKWDQLMAMTFAGDTEREQELLLEEFFGAAILGFAGRYEKALLMYGKGRAGKGTIMKIIGSIIPRSAKSAVPPDKWDREYYLAALAGSRLNLVGEVSDVLPIDGATFKAVLGRDDLTARQPTHRTFTFANTAAHAFNGNYFPASRDHGAEFFSRWIIMYFRNSLIGRDELINVDLAQEIIDEELPGVVARLLKGAQRLLARGRFKLTTVHHQMITQWQNKSSSAVEFFADTDIVVLGEYPHIACNRLMIYEEYRKWCSQSGRKHMGKQKFYSEFDSPGVIAMGVRFVKKTGGTILVRGMALRSQLFDSEVWEDDSL